MACAVQMEIFCKDIVRHDELHNNIKYNCVIKMSKPNS